MTSPARDALEALVAQFSERSAFVRELVQNSLDAGAGRVELNVVQEKRRMVIDVTDDGEGMDREVIETHLLTLFSSSKEKDLTKIGKFGIGFVSLFALKPELVVVDTARDGVHHRVIFDADWSYTLAELDEPFEGTRVRLYVRTWGKKGEALAGELRQAIHYWCKHARAEIWTVGQGKGWSWDEEVVGTWDVDAILKIEVESPGFRAVLGPWPEKVTPVAYVNRGLTLLEGREDTVPGVTFRIEAAQLEHTLTRDNVLRDAGFEEVVEHLRQLARGPLTNKLTEEIRASVAAQDNERIEALVRAGQHLPIPEDLAWIPLANGGYARMEDFEPSSWVMFGEQPLWYAPGPSALVRALGEEGSQVLSGAPDSMAASRLCARWSGLVPKPVAEAWIKPQLGPEPRLAAAMRRVAKTNPMVGRELICARFAEGGSRLQGRLAILQREPGQLQQELDDDGVLVINVDHPHFKRAAALPADIGGSVLLVAALRAVGDNVRLTSGVLLDLLS